MEEKANIVKAAGEKSAIKDSVAGKKEAANDSKKIVKRDRSKSATRKDEENKQAENPTAMDPATATAAKDDTTVPKPANKKPKKAAVINPSGADKDIATGNITDKVETVSDISKQTNNKVGLTLYMRITFYNTNFSIFAFNTTHEHLKYL